MVQVLIEADLASVTKDISNNIKLNELCDKLYSISGVEPSDMKLTVFKGEDATVMTLRDTDPNSQPLFCENGVVVSTIVVEDTNVNSMMNQLKNSTRDGVDESIAFKLTDEEYAKKADSVLQWKKQQQLGRFDPGYVERREKEIKLQDEKATALELNQRCCVKTEDQAERRGWLRYIGKIPSIGAEEVWCGIEFDEPLGKNNGTYKGEIYFGPVGDKYGGFIKPIFVETGARFEPFDIGLDSDDEI